MHFITCNCSSLTKQTIQTFVLELRYILHGMFYQNYWDIVEHAGINICMVNQHNKTF